MRRSPGEAELALDFNIAEATIERLGPLLLTASIHGEPLARQEYRQAGLVRKLAAPFLAVARVSESGALALANVRGPALHWACTAPGCCRHV